MNKIDETETTHTPISLMAVFADAFKIEPNKQSFLLRGIYQDRKRNSYRGYYFDRLKDERGGQIITLKLPEKLKQQVADGGFYCFQGQLQKDVRWDGVIEPVFLVTRLVQQIADDDVGRADIRATLRQAKVGQGYGDLEAKLRAILAEGQRPHIALISGKTSIVLLDLFAALKQARNSYQFSEQRINLLDKEAIIHALLAADEKFDLIAIIRGGGPGLQIFDDVEIAEAALQLKSDLATAVGHAQDETLLEQIADQRFTTPTAFGTFLRETGVASQEPANAKTTKPTQATPANRLVIWILLAAMLLTLGVLLGMALS
ncbi:exodeoxyribonuclease VII large subunit [Candidatus Leptofilum sp.]|uniref:exodeoxyribonuclease VII large subunit n=1 Tax=Candidatus Leptofilum sp. TaxID=3241576 RepID=UPI003B5A48F0